MEAADLTPDALDSDPPSRRHGGWGVVIFLLVLALHAGLAVARHSDHLVWDEGRYLGYAQHLTQGYYVTDENPDFVNGPGYPVLLMPFVSGPKAWLWARLLNALLIAGSAGFVWLTVRHYAGPRWGAVAAVVVGLHPTLLWMSYSLMTEPLAMFCLCGFLWAGCAWMRQGCGGGGWLWLGGASVMLAWLILTRVFFGHVITATALFCLAALPFFRSWRPVLRRGLVLMVAAFLLCTPYLAFTWKKTGEVLCWSTNSGELLYWMTSTYPGENGHWFSIEDAHDLPALAPHHAKFYTHVYSLPVLEREAVFKAEALRFAKQNPAGVVYNWVCNLSRLAFGFPRSFQPEELRTTVLIFVNGPLILLASAAGLLALRRWRTLPAEIWVLVAFVCFYLSGSSLAPALPRYFVLAVPILLLALATTLRRHVRMTLSPAQSAEL